LVSDFHVVFEHPDPAGYGYRCRERLVRRRARRGHHQRLHLDCAEGLPRHRPPASRRRRHLHALKEPAAEQGFGSFNSITDTIEWRWVKGAAKPFAIIQRWTYADNENLAETGRPKDVPVLIVTRLPPGPVCQVARIDVKKGEDANVAARNAADSTAGTFKCEAKAAPSQ
jgi:hypothetical protein